MLTLFMRVHGAFSLLKDAVIHRHKELKRYVSDKTQRSK